MAATKRAVDMTNVKEAGAFNPRRKPEGDYRAKIAKVEDHKSKKGNEQWVFTIQLADDQRATYPYYCGFEEKEAWKIRNLLIACGKKVPKKRVNVDPNSLVGKEIGISLVDDEYEGKLKSTIDAVFPADDLGEADEPEDEDTDTDDEDEEDEVDTDDDSDDEDEEDSEDDDDDEEPEPEPEPVKKKAKKKAAAPAPAKKAAKAKGKKKKAKDDDEDDDLDEIDI